MNTNYKSRTKTSTDNNRSYFDWSSKMQIVHRGNGDIAITEGELARFFGVTWSKLNHRLQTIIKSISLHPEETVADEEEVVINGQFKGYAPLYPLPIIIALSFQLDSTEAHLFRKYICERLQKSASMITPIFLIDNTNN
jgi:hypothetical protein